MSKLVPFTLTLTRWHHVGSRIKALSTAQLNEARQVLGGTNVENALSEEQIQALKGRGAKALALLDQGMAALAVVGKIRAELARANGAHEVSALLAEAEDKRAQARALEAFSGIDLLTATSVDKANELLSAKGEDKNRLAMLRGVRVALVPVDSLDFVNDQRRNLEAQAAAISDQVAEINRKTLTIHLDAELAKAVGL